jgi:leucyl-tRNA synthetase
MKNTKKLYDPAAIEPKWQSEWENNGLYHLNLETAKRPFYNLMMFPYPSAEGMHAGNFFTFTGADTFGRFKRMQGHDVFEPIGLDGFGIHSENYAIKVGSHPVEQSQKSEENFYRQFRATGNMYDFTRTVETYKPDYYKWTQWVFIQLFKKGLAYRKKSPVNFCPSCKTVLADEQVIDGKCERCSSVVEKKNLEQWFFRITKYADRLLANIDQLDWTEKIKIAQKNWIGKSEGARIEFRIKNSELKIEVFTTAIDTIFGVTFMVVSPEHPLVDAILNRQIAVSDLEQIQQYVDVAKNKPEQERLAEGKDKTGVSTGIKVINPFNGEEVPIWIADYVLMGYGTGAVMGVPGHDARDHEFALKFKLQVKPVVKPQEGIEGAVVEEDGFWNYLELKTKFADKSVLYGSGEFDGLTNTEAKEKMLDYIEKEGFGERTTTYHLRDWLISRQRYWGPPIPMIYCAQCADQGKSWFTSNAAKDTLVYNIEHLIAQDADTSEVAGWYPVEEKDLPVKLPYIEDFKPLGTDKSPLGNHPEFYEIACPECGAAARRETDVSDTFLDSAWYFFRYISTEFNDKPFDKLRAKKWLPVNMYIGGAEHSVLHLLYARFITMVIKDLGLIDFEEPFSRFYAHGLIIKDGAKMSKSKGNIINPDEYIKKYGADTLRMYLRFLAPFNQSGDFRDSGIEGMNRFVKRVWAMLAGREFPDTTPTDSATGVMHQAIKKVTEEMEALRFNTAIAQMMTWYNFLSQQKEITRVEAENYLKMLAPLAPHMTEELYQGLKIKDLRLKNVEKEFESIHTQPWPIYEEKYLVRDTLTIPVQVNGKHRGTLNIATADAEDQVKIEELARSDKQVNKFIEGKTIKKAIYIKGKVINFVV